jgi:hypothetical protein
MRAANCWDSSQLYPPALAKQIIDIAKPLGIAVHDHIIVGKNGHAT